MLLICETLIIIMIYYEYKHYKVVATPMVLLGGIYTLFMPLINTVGRQMGFFGLTDETIVLFTFFFIILFVCGQLWRKYSNKKKFVQTYTSENNLINKEKLIWRIYFFGLIAYIISLVQVITKYGIDNTKSNAYGPFAHIAFIARCLLPIIIYYAISKRKIKYIIAVIVNIVAMIMFKGKYHLYIATAGFVVLILLTKQNIKIKKIIKIVCITFVGALLLFVSVYTVIPNILAGDLSISSMSSGIGFSIKHFFHYLFCPFICSNIYFNNPCYFGMEDGMRTVFNPFDRIFQWISGGEEYFDPAIKLWVPVDDIGTTANVGGLFSETVFNIGYIGAIIYVILVGFLVYYFLNKTLYTGKRLISTVYLLGMLMVCFFCNYFSLLPNIECFFIAYLIDFFIMDHSIKIRKIAYK